jgi:hypothetical protein
MAAAVQDATNGVIFPSGVDGVQPFRTVITVPTTSIDDDNDDILLVKFPAGAYLDTDSLAVEPSALDGASNTLVWEIGLGPATGVIATSLITESTSPSTGTRMAADADLDKFVDAGGLYLIATAITAATTAAAGTVGVEGYYAPGLVPRTAE